MQYDGSRLAGIQYKHTAFVSLTGPEVLVPHQNVDWHWEFTGVGRTYCYVDGKRYENDADHTCTPPLTVDLPDTKNHTLIVFYQVSKPRSRGRACVGVAWRASVSRQGSSTCQASAAMHLITLCELRH
jgi:hypothetical protein